MRPLFAIALVAIIHLSLHPWHFVFTGSHRSLEGYGIVSRSDYTDTLLNLFFYIPPALIGQWAFQTPRTKLRTLLLIVSGLILLSFTIENLQLFIPGRHGNLRDFICNSAGALAGALLGFVIPPPTRLFASWKLPPHAAGLAIYLTAFATWLAFPFMPHLRWHRVTLIPELLLHPSWPWNELGDLFFVLLVIYLMARHLQLSALPVTAAAALLIPSQTFLRDVELSLARLITAGAALLTALILLRRPTRRHHLSLALLITAWILYRQLSPGQFAPHPINAFDWIPFQPFIEVGGHIGSLRILCGKFLLYTGALWLSTRAGLSTRLAACALLLLLTLTETLQRYLPGRTPETTDFALALLGIWTVYLSKPHFSDTPLPGAHQ